MESNESQAENYIRLIKNYKKAAALAEAAENEEIRNGYLVINYEEIQFEYRQVVPEQVAMMIPMVFALMAETVIQAKYPGEDRPDYIYTSADSKINLTFSIDQGLIDDDEVDGVRKKIMKQMQRMHPGIEISGDSLSINEKTVSYFSFTVPVIDGSLFHLMYFMEFQNCLLIGGFNCNSHDKKDWFPVFMKMMETIEVIAK